MTTSKASSTFLFAALVLTSGVCLSDAFPASNLPRNRPAPSASSLARSYAPNDSLEGPKRKRSRPRKANSPKKKATPRNSSTSTAATATATESSTVKRQRTKTKKRKPKKATQKEYSLKALLNHELLTKEEEIELATKIRRASELQETMAAWIDENQSRIQQQQRYSRIEGYNNLYNSEDEDINNPLLGSANSQAIERYLTQDGDDDDFFDTYGSVLGGVEEYMGDFSVYEPQMQQLAPAVPESWMDEILLQGDDDKLSVESILSDHDIRTVFNLQGGRSELRKIFLEGAMAREKLISSNIKLAYSIAKKWVGTDSEKGGDSLVRAYTGSAFVTGRPTLEELMQEGIMGLARAAERFDPDRNVRFSTYATWLVTNSIRQCFQLESSSGLRLPALYYDIKGKYVKLARQYLATEKQVPSPETMADEIGVSVKRLITVLRMTQPLQSLDADRGGTSQGTAGAGKAGSAGGSDDGEYTLASLLPSEEPEPGDICERSLLRQCLENAMATELSPYERDVVRLRLGLDDGVPQSQKEVAEIFGIAGGTISGVEQRALSKLRSPVGVHTQQLLAYLDFAGIDGRHMQR